MNFHPKDEDNDLVLVPASSDAVAGGDAPPPSLNLSAESAVLSTGWCRDITDTTSKRRSGGGVFFRAQGAAASRSSSSSRPPAAQMLLLPDDCSSSGQRDLVLTGDPVVADSTEFPRTTHWPPAVQPACPAKMEMREGQEPLPPSLQSSTPPPEFLVKLYTLLITESPDIIEFIEGRIHLKDPVTFYGTVLQKYWSHNNFASFNRQLNYFRYLKLKKGMGRGRDTPCIYEHKGMVGKCLEDLLQLRRCTQRRRFRRPARCSSASPTNSNPEQLSGKWLEGGPLGQTLGLPLQSRVTGRCSSAPPQFLNQSLKCIASHDIVSGSTDTSESIYGISFEKPSSAVVRPDYDHFTSGDWSFGKDEPTAVSSTFGGTSSKDRNADAHEHSRMHSYAFEDAKDELNMAELELLFMNNSADQRDGSGGPDRNRHAGWRDTASNSGNSIFKSASFPRK